MLRYCEHLLKVYHNPSLRVFCVWVRMSETGAWHRRRQASTLRVCTGMSLSVPAPCRTLHPYLEQRYLSWSTHFCFWDPESECLKAAEVVVRANITLLKRRARLLKRRGRKDRRCCNTCICFSGFVFEITIRAIVPWCTPRMCSSRKVTASYWLPTMVCLVVACTPHSHPVALNETASTLVTLFVL
jgi:hypothetical protein